MNILHRVTGRTRRLRNHRECVEVDLWLATIHSTTPDPELATRLTAATRPAKTEGVTK